MDRKSAIEKTMRVILVFLTLASTGLVFIGFVSDRVWSGFGLVFLVTLVICQMPFYLGAGGLMTLDGKEKSAISSPSVIGTGFPESKLPCPTKVLSAL